MKKSANKAMLGIIAMIASVGTVHAESGRVEISAHKQAVVDELVRNGYLMPTESPDWYQINADRLNETGGDSEDAQAQDTIKKLKSIVGESVDIKSVSIFNARVGGQDYAGN